MPPMQRFQLIDKRKAYPDARIRLLWSKDLVAEKEDLKMIRFAKQWEIELIELEDLKPISDPLTCDADLLALIDKEKEAVKARKPGYHAVIMSDLARHHYGFMSSYTHPEGQQRDASWIYIDFDRPVHPVHYKLEFEYHGTDSSCMWNIIQQDEDEPVDYVNDVFAIPHALTQEAKQEQQQTIKKYQRFILDRFFQFHTHFQQKPEFLRYRDFLNKQNPTFIWKGENDPSFREKLFHILSGSVIWRENLFFDMVIHTSGPKALGEWILAQAMKRKLYVDTVARHHSLGTTPLRRFLALDRGVSDLSWTKDGSAKIAKKAEQIAAEIIVSAYRKYRASTKGQAKLRPSEADKRQVDTGPVQAPANSIRVN